MGGDDDTGEVPTELAPSAEPTEAVIAWSLADDEDWPPPRLTPGRITALAVAGALVLLAAAGVLAAWHLRTPEPTVQATPSVSAPPPSPIRLPPPPPTSLPPPPPVTSTVVVSTVVAAPPQPAPTQPDYTVLLQRRLEAQGWRIWDPAQAGRTANLVCASFNQGASFDQIAAVLMRDNGGTWSQAASFINTVTAVYPNCP